MNKQMFVYNAHAGDNTNFVYIPKKEQKANFVYKALYEIARISSRKVIKGCVPLLYGQ